MIWIAFVGGLVIGALVVVLLSKNNKNTIAKIRGEVLAAAAKGEAEVKKVIEKY
jgi:uncharacterized membrane-anchored protein YhcB (DUF1043 family)